VRAGVEPAGILTKQYAFFRADRRLDMDAFRAQIDACLGAGAPRIAILGLVTEVTKLSPDERSALLEAAATATRGFAPLTVTVVGQTPEAQITIVREAERLGAANVILQPPRIPGLSEGELVRFFGRVIDSAALPVGIQNAPEYIGEGLGVEAIAALTRRHSNFRILKTEGAATMLHRTVEQTRGSLAVLSGRAGLELPDNRRAGANGVIPGTEVTDLLVRVWNGLGGDTASKEEAEALYREVLPLLTFLMQSLDQFLCYGKRLIAQRLGLGEIHDRAPTLAPTEFGLACLAKHAMRFGTFS